MVDKLPKCEHCGQTIRKPRIKPLALIIKHAVIASVKYLCKSDDVRIADRFLTKFGTQYSHGLVFDGYEFPNQIINNEKLYVPGADVGMMMRCGTSTALGRPAATWLFYYNDEFYFILSYAELGVSGKTSTPGIKIDGNRAKPLQLATPEHQEIIIKALKVYNESMADEHDDFIVGALWYE